MAKVEEQGKRKKKKKQSLEIGAYCRTKERFREGSQTHPGIENGLMQSESLSADKNCR